MYGAPAKGLQTRVRSSVETCRHCTETEIVPVLKSSGFNVAILIPLIGLVVIGFVVRMAMRVRSEQRDGQRDGGSCRPVLTATTGNAGSTHVTNQGASAGAPFSVPGAG